MIEPGAHTVSFTEGDMPPNQLSLAIDQAQISS